MDKATGKLFIVDGNEVTSEVTFTPTEPSGTVDVLFTFDSKYIKTETNIVVFESIYKDGTELAVHADIDDIDQTVTVKIPEIKTMAEIKGKKKVTATKKITVVDTVSYTNLTVGKEYELKGVLMDNATGKPYMVDGKEVVSVVKFTPTESNGTVDVKFTFNGSGINKTTELVVFETLYRDGVELTSQTSSHYRQPPTVKRDPTQLVKALLETSNVEYQTAENTPDDRAAYFDTETSTLYIKEGVGDGTKLFQEIACELAIAEIYFNSEEFSRVEAQFPAQCASYMICQKYGVDTKGIDVAKTPLHWKAMKNQDIRSELTMARDSLNEISTKLYFELNKDKAPREQDAR